jgi:pimeloyl-ACP methyl ester carboxylesterase
MAMITTADGTEIFYKDWGSGQPIVFSHGWPLSADDWDTPGRVHQARHHLPQRPPLTLRRTGPATGQGTS